MQNFRDLKVWQKSHDFVLTIYRMTAEFPKEEIYGLMAQLRRSASSIPANICEGCGRSGGADFARFLQIAMGSATETEYHLLLAKDLDFIPDSVFEHLYQDITEIQKMLTALIVKLRNPRN